jgi:hypothetical protein
MNHAVAIIRSNQDIMGMLIFGGVFERHPQLAIVCVEADAGWAPHWMYRMDHYYKRHQYMRFTELSRLPSEYFRDHIYLTFQDDWAAFQTTHLQNAERLMWGNDFPHSDSTWPWSQDVLREQTAHLSDATRDLILHDNVASLGLHLDCGTVVDGRAPRKADVAIGRSHRRGRRGPPSLSAPSTWPVRWRPLHRRPHALRRAILWDAC